MAVGFLKNIFTWGWLIPQINDLLSNMRSYLIIKIAEPYSKYLPENTLTNSQVYNIQSSKSISERSYISENCLKSMQSFLLATYWTISLWIKSVETDVPGQHLTDPLLSCFYGCVVGCHWLRLGFTLWSGRMNHVLGSPVTVLVKGLVVVLHSNLFMWLLGGSFFLVLV